MKTHKQPLQLSPYPQPPNKKLAKASDFQWYLLPGARMKSCILVVATKQIHITHTAFFNCSSSLYCENEHFSRKF